MQFPTPFSRRQWFPFRSGREVWMRPSRKVPDGSGDLFRARLDQIINIRHELARLADEVDCGWIDEELSVFYREKTDR